LSVSDVLKISGYTRVNAAVTALKHRQFQSASVYPTVSSDNFIKISSAGEISQRQVPLLTGRVERQRLRRRFGHAMRKAETTRVPKNGPRLRI